MPVPSANDVIAQQDYLRFKHRAQEHFALVRPGVAPKAGWVGVNTGIKPGMTIVAEECDEEAVCLHSLAFAMLSQVTVRAYRGAVLRAAVLACLAIGVLVDFFVDVVEPLEWFSH